MSRTKILQIARPRFWMYTFGPFLVGIVAARVSTYGATHPRPILASLPRYVLLIVIIAVDYRLIGANILIYGINDLADTDTDALNDKKWDYEHALQSSEQSTLRTWVTGITVGEWWALLLGLTRLIWRYQPSLWRQPIIVMGAFWLTSIYYSAPPIRAKEHPFIDGVFNVLYIIPALAGRLLIVGDLSWVSWLWFGAGWVRAAAMHAYSAIPDIQPDQEAGLRTTAVYLGRNKTLIYCTWLWICAATMGAEVLGRRVYVLLIPYLVMITLSRRGDIMSLYRRFPWINTAIWFIVFRGVVLWR